MSTIQVRSETQQIIVDPATSVVSIINAGPQGPPGVGGTAAYFVHTQVAVSTSWVVNHNLGFNPSVDIIDSNGNIVEGHIIYHTLNQLEVQLLTPRAGTARLS